MGDVQPLKLGYDQFGLTSHSSFFVLKRSAANHDKYRWIRDDLVLRKSGGASKLIGCCIEITELKIQEKKFRRVRAHYSYAQKIARLGSWHYERRNEGGELFFLSLPRLR